jgi:hypothetical protein
VLTLDELGADVVSGETDPVVAFTDMRGRHRLGADPLFERG